MFQFNEENEKKARDITSKYPKGCSRSAVMPLLWLAQEQDGDNFLPKEKLEFVANYLDIPLIQVYEIVSFYTMYNAENVGKYHLQICGTVPCHLVGAKEIFKTAKKLLGVDKNTITSDGKFSFTEVECLGACADAPVIQINNKHYVTKVTPEKAINLINEIEKYTKT